MPEEHKYDVQAHDFMLPGRELKIERTVHCNRYDISDLLKRPVDEVEEMFRESADGEEKAVEIVKAAVSQWEKQAAVSQQLFRALDYLKTPSVEHTGNQWIENGHDSRKIQNMVYQMTYRIYKDSPKTPSVGKETLEHWYVDWDVRLNSPKKNHNFMIATNQRHYTDREKAEKYLNGRIKAFSGLFSELSPPVPVQYAECFTVSGQVLPGYRIEGQETLLDSKPAVAEVSEGGVSIPDKAEKESVLGKLSAAKTQEKTPAIPGAANKKKEDMQL